MDKNAVLSVSRDRGLLAQREVSLKNAGFQVISLESESQARFEIEMGRCGVLLICFRSLHQCASNLTHLFRKSCPDGMVILVVNRITNSIHVGDYMVLESAGPEAIVEILRSDPKARTLSDSSNDAPDSVAS